MNPKQEAEQLVGALYEKFGSGKWIDGIESILEMKAANTRTWRESEWPNFYLKYILETYCLRNPKCGMIPYKEVKRYLIKGHTLWDFRVHNSIAEEIPLSDFDEYNNLISKNNGIGIISVDADMIIDKSGKVKARHEEVKGKSTKYTIEGEQKGVNPQPRKEKIKIKQVSAYFFKPGELTKGVKDGWAIDDFQKRMKNTNDAKRKGKYALLKSKIPPEYLLYSRSF